jgi:nucleoside-diphosphate-sugar epimerase
MTRISDPAVLVTGATGFIGRHVVRRLLRSGRRVVIVARYRNGLTAEQRVAAIFGDLSSRIEVIEGDLASASGMEGQLAGLRSNVDTAIHCAGETSFLAGDGESARAIQVDGPLLLLEMLGTLGLRSWAQISTAFVCGGRSGIIYENEADVRQEFHNAYERLKLESEIRLKQACGQLGIELRIFRPSIVIGAAPATSGGVPSNLFFAFLRVLMALARSPGDKDVPVRIQTRPQARFNIVPVEYVATAIEQLTVDPRASGKTFHLVAPNPPTQQTMLEMMSARLHLQNLHLLGPGEKLSNPSLLESRLVKMLLPYREYLEQDVQFDCSEARRLLEPHDVQGPAIDGREVDRLIELARGNSNRTQGRRMGTA